MASNQKVNPKAAKEAPLLTPVSSPAAERLKLALVIVVAMLLAAILAAGGTWWLMEQMRPQLPADALSVENSLAMPPPVPPIYENLDPPFVVNLKQGGQGRYLQVSVALMSRHAEQLNTLKAHLPLLRSRLLMLFSGQEIDGLTTAEGKEALRQKATHEVQDMAERLTGMPVVEQVLFTGLVVQ